ncbi:MAG: caspase family protein, partial [Calditrichia bacterium]|nr:caspase family protein [Calditrichia bacterium]
TASSSEASFSVYGGYYNFAHLRDEKGWSSTRTVKIDQSRGFKIETQIKKISGILNNGYGLIWGRKDSDNEFKFFVSGDGYFQVNKSSGGKKTQLKPWQTSGAINQGNGAVNKLTITKRNNYLTFFINDINVYSMYFQNFYGDRLGFVVYKRQKIAVDYLKVSYLKESTFNSPPTIVITEPSQIRGMKKVTNRSLRIAGQAKDSDGIYKVTVNGLRADVLSNGNFSLDLPLSSGKNTITVSATDKKMKSSTKTFSVTRETQSFAQNLFSTKQKRLALVIGNAKYIHGGSLENPVNDAYSMKGVLEQMGFTVLKYENGDQKTIRRAIDEFGKQLKGFDVALFFYAGHGIQVNGMNYLVPVDAKLENENDVEYDAVRA